MGGGGWAEGARGEWVCLSCWAIFFSFEASAKVEVVSTFVQCCMIVSRSRFSGAISVGIIVLYMTRDKLRALCALVLFSSQVLPRVFL